MMWILTSLSPNISKKKKNGLFSLSQRFSESMGSGTKEANIITTEWECFQACIDVVDLT